MLRDRLKQSLKHVGVPPEDAGVLALLPLVYVAWADGKMEKVEKSRIHDFAVKHFELSPKGLTVLSGWLERPPSRGYIAEGLHDLYELAISEDDHQVDLSELPGLVSYSEAIARTTAAALDDPSAVTPVEEDALEEIARALHVEHGESWAKLLAELGG